MLNIFYIQPREKKRWIEGDQIIRAWIRRMIRGTPPVGGVERVFLNFRQSLESFHIPHRNNPRVEEVEPGDINILFGRGTEPLKYLSGINLILAIGVVNHPEDFPDLHTRPNVRAFVSHSDWINQICRAYYGDICYTWPAGIDIEKWKPSNDEKEYYVVYDKIRWHHEKEYTELLNPLLDYLNRLQIPYKVIRYGHYREEDYFTLLQKAKGMIFICEHETQGIACNQAMSMDIPILAWDRGALTDPNYVAYSKRFPLGFPTVTTVPFFDSSCGERFRSLEEFYELAPHYFQKVGNGAYHPAEYVRTHLSFKASLIRMDEISRQVFQKSFLENTALSDSGESVSKI